MHTIDDNGLVLRYIPTDLFRFPSSGNKRARELFLQRRPSVEAPSERTHVLLLPRDLIHRAVTDLRDDRIGYVRDLLIDEADWKVRFLHVTGGGTWASTSTTS